MAGFLTKPPKVTGKPSASSAPRKASGISDSTSPRIPESRVGHDTRHPDSQQYVRRDRKSMDYC